MYIAKKYFETNKGQFKKGQEVPADIAVRYIREVNLVNGVINETVPQVEEELLIETPQAVEVVVEEDEVEAKPKKKKGKK